LQNAAIFIDETFNYSVTNLANETSWTTAGTLTTGTGRNIVSSALTYTTNGKTYILSGVGKTLNSDISVSSDYKAYKPFGSSAVNSGVFVRFVSVQSRCCARSNTIGSFRIGKWHKSGTRIWAGKGVISTANYRFGLTRGSTTEQILFGIQQSFRMFLKLFY
jgi:hypothetical protein